MSGQAPYGFRLEPTTVEGIRTKMMVPDPVAADHVRLMFEMYAEPGTSFGDISRYFEENDIKVNGKSLFRPFLSQLPRNPVYAQTDLELANITFQNGRKARNTWLAGKVKCGKYGYALKVTRNPSGYEYLRCNKRSDHKGCPGCGTLRKVEFEQFIFNAMGEKFRDFKHLRGGEEKANPKLTAYQVELAQVEAEIEKLLDTLTGANATQLAYANNTIEGLPNLPYSVEEIYGIRESGKYASLKQTYNELFHIYGREDYAGLVKPEYVIVEDSNSGYEFFSEVMGKRDIEVSSVRGKSNIF